MEGFELHSYQFSLSYFNWQGIRVQALHQLSDKAPRTVFVSVQSLLLDAESGVVTLCCFVSPFCVDRDRAKKIYEKAGLPFLESSSTPR
ncbi:hypothetical protein OUZ56_029773 [Daphnia magna]|uniref:APS kinase domain-containing protein n=1 Tax=Daphnia magna TaxID=35525 RepID=A0ABR0B7T2_9CRUS|nr:hypothetical protein OUZ56_029773 [Daphnia magna]